MTGFRNEVCRHLQPQYVHNGKCTSTCHPIEPCDGMCRCMLFRGMRAVGDSAETVFSIVTSESQDSDVPCFPAAYEDVSWWDPLTHPEDETHADGRCSWIILNTSRATL